MCKPSCCPGNSTGSGLGIALAAVAGPALVTAAARPLIHAVEVIAQVTLITLGTLLVLALTAAMTVLVLRTRRARHRVAVPPFRGQLATRTAATVSPPAPTWARAAITRRISALGTANRCPACGSTPREPRRP